MTLVSYGCLPPPSTKSSQQEIQVSGRFTGAEACPHKLVVDVLLKGENEPIDIPDITPSGTFSIKIAPEYRETPLHIQGFCYASDEDFAINSSAWQTEPLSITPSEWVDNDLELSRNRSRPEPAIQETIPTEWSTLAKHPKWVQFYGLRHPDNSDKNAGTMPEIRNGGLSTLTHCTYNQALYGKIQQASPPNMHPLLLPSITMLEDACANEDPMTLQMQIVQQHLRNSCQALNLSCPSVNILRMQNWIPNNKSFVAGDANVIQRAHLWLLFQHLVVLAKSQGHDPTPFIPDLQSLDWQVQCTRVEDGYNRLKIAIPTTSQSWFKECLPME